MLCLDMDFISFIILEKFGLSWICGLVWLINSEKFLAILSLSYASIPFSIVDTSIKHMLDLLILSPLLFNSLSNFLFLSCILDHLFWCVFYFILSLLLSNMLLNALIEFSRDGRHGKLGLVNCKARKISTVNIGVIPIKTIHSSIYSSP